jgi:copper chaperone CopZ
MMCPEGCGEKVKEILAEQPGAKEVLVDFDAKTATVAIESGGNFDTSAAVAALVDHGFKNSTLKGEASATAPGDGAAHKTPPEPAIPPKKETAI